MRDIDRYQAAYRANYGFEQHMVRYRRRTILECLARYPHRHILEVGCGIEPLFLHIDDWESYVVVEPGEEFATEARNRAPRGRQVTVLPMPLESAAGELAGRAFDFIVVSSVLHEVASPGALLEAAYTLCGTDTTVHVNVPNAASLHNRIALQMGLISDLFARSPLAHQLQRTTTYDLMTLQKAVVEAGFRVEEAGSYFLKPFTHGQLQSMIEHGIIDERVLDALYDVNADFDGLGAEIYVQVRRA